MISDWVHFICEAMIHCKLDNTVITQHDKDDKELVIMLLAAISDRGMDNIRYACNLPYIELIKNIVRDTKTKNLSYVAYFIMITTAIYVIQSDIDDYTSMLKILVTDTLMGILPSLDRGKDILSVLCNCKIREVIQLAKE